MADEPPPAAPRGDRRSTMAAAATFAGVTLLVFFPTWLEPRRHILGFWRHPDCLSNHWLFRWVADRLAHGGGLLHNDLYYHPFGDYPFLAGNGSDAIGAAPWLWVLGWPAGLNVYYLLIVLGGCWAAYLLARQLGASPRGALIGGVLYGVNPYVLGELSTGRFAQAPILWMALFLAAWIALLRRPGHRTAVLAGALYAVNALVYWYYGLFATFAGAVVLAVWAATHRGEVRARVMPLVTFAAVCVATLAYPLGWFLAHWSDIPGTVGDASARDVAIEASLRLTWPIVDPVPRDGAIVVPIAGLLLGGLAAARVLRRHPGAPRRWTDAAMLAVAVVFYVLSLGPYLRIWDGGPLTWLPLPFAWIYDHVAPLERFWWPRRHALLVFLAVAVLAARGWTMLEPRLSPRWALAVAVAVAALVPVDQMLRSDGAVVWSSVWQPPAAYLALADQPGEALLELPLDPRVTTNQDSLLYQPLHGKKLINGHAQWVPRVRPAAWDAWIRENSLLAALCDHETRRGDGTFRFDPADLDELEGLGLRLITVNRENYTHPLWPLYLSERELMQGLFGAPVLTTAFFEAYDVAGWTGVAELSVPYPAGPSRLPDTIHDKPLPGAPFPSLGFGSLESRSAMRPIPAGVAPRQTRVLDADGATVAIEGVHYQRWTAEERAWLARAGWRTSAR